MIEFLIALKAKNKLKKLELRLDETLITYKTLMVIGVIINVLFSLEEVVVTFKRS